MNVKNKKIKNTGEKEDKKIFAGQNAIFEFLKPESLGFSPVIELPASLNPFLKDKVRIFIKMSELVPLGNIKSLPSYMMLQNIPKNELKKIKNLVEYSSGNTVLSLAVLSRHFGIKNMHAIITPDVPEPKRKLLNLVGANLLISHGPPSPDVHENIGGIFEAKTLARKKGWHNLNQYVNPGSILASQKYIGEEIWEQFGKDLSVFMASIGTAGTITGAGAYLRDQNKKIKIIGTAIKKGSSIPGPRGEVMIHKLGIPWEKVVHEVIAMNAEEAFKKSLELIRLGLFVGPSTGMQLASLLLKLKEYKKKKLLNGLRNKKGEVVCCFLACDSMSPYIDEYFNVLPAKYFPKEKHI